MNKAIYQIRFGTKNDNITLEQLTSTTGLVDSDNIIIDNIEQVNIETKPGTKFYLNNKSMRIGTTGIYEVSFTESTIQSLYFDSVQPPTFVLINIVYYKEETESGETDTTNQV